MKNVDDYIKSFPKETQVLLEHMRSVIKKIAPDAEESISYGMPAYTYCGKPLVYFAAFKHHIGFYATPHGHEVFQPELSRYKSGKGSVQFPMNEPLPLDLIEKMVKFKMQENQK